MTEPSRDARRRRFQRTIGAAPGLFVSLAAIVVSGWAAILLVGRVNGLSAPPYDLAFFQQIVWNVGANGHWISSFHQGSFLGLHFSPILAVPAVIERVLGPDVRTLNLLHAVAVGALVPASFLFLRSMLRPARWGPAIAAALAAGVPVWGTMQDVIRSDFHPETAGVGLALLAGWAGLTGRRRTMWALAILALATREDVSYAVAIIGLVVAARGRGIMRRHGKVLAIGAFCWAIVVFGILMPTIRAGVATDTDHYYAWLGGGLGVLLAPFNQTSAVVAHIARPTPWLAAAGMLIGLLGLPLLRPRWAILGLPPMLALLLSDNFLQADIRLQYGLILVVPFVVAAGFGARRILAVVVTLARWSRRRHRLREGGAVAPSAHAWTSAALMLVLVVPAAIGSWIQGSLPPFDFSDPAFASRPAGLDRLVEVAGVIPQHAVLAADEGLVAPLAARPEVRRLMAAAVPPPEAFVVVDRAAWSPTAELERRHDQILKMLLAGGRPVLADDGEFVVWGPEPGTPAP